MNLTPLIDVVFLLLIFFMVSTTFKQEAHIEIDLPQAGGTQTDVVENLPEIVISATGEYQISGTRIGSDTAALREALSALKAGVEAGQPLIISADAATPHQAVVTAMDVAGELGFIRLSITTRKSDP